MIEKLTQFQITNNALEELNHRSILWNKVNEIIGYCNNLEPKLKHDNGCTCVRCMPDIYPTKKDNL